MDMYYVNEYIKRHLSIQGERNDVYTKLPLNKNNRMSRIVYNHPYYQRYTLSASNFLILISKMQTMLISGETAR